MAGTNRPTPRWLTRLLAAAAIGLTLPGEGRAFYFDYGPGSGAKPPPTLIPPGQNESVINPNPGGEPTPPEVPNVPNETPPGEHAPEPATGVAGLIGLGLVGLIRRRMK